MGRRVEQVVERLLFGSRWLLAPFYVGLMASFFLLFVVFVRELIHAVLGIADMPVEGAILSILSLIDLALAANLVVVVILAGYESFVSRIETAAGEDRPAWMGKVGFAGLKLKLYGSIVAISAIQLLKEFMQLGTHPVDDRTLGWLTAVHFTFVLTALLAALTDWLSARSHGSSA